MPVDEAGELINITTMTSACSHWIVTKHQIDPTILVDFIIIIIIIIKFSFIRTRTIPSVTDAGRIYKSNAK